MAKFWGLLEALFADNVVMVSFQIFFQKKWKSTKLPSGLNSEKPLLSAW
jgi:hypothetical protein